MTGSNEGTVHVEVVDVPFVDEGGLSLPTVSAMGGGKCGMDADGGSAGMCAVEPLAEEAKSFTSLPLQSIQKV